MKKVVFKIFVVMIFFIIVTPTYAQFNIKKAIGGAAKAVKAFTLTDEQMAEYVKESVDWMEEHNPACPDGSVRVFSSLMDIMNDDELLGIIGHEIGHVLKRHSKNAFKNELLTGALKDVVASTSGKVAALTESQLGSLGQSLMNAKFSQQQENEADDCGYDFLVAQGRNPWGIVMSFEKLMNLEGDSGSKQSYIQKMFSSHPETQKRIKHMQKRCEEDGIVRPAA